MESGRAIDMVFILIEEKSVAGVSTDVHESLLAGALCLQGFVRRVSTPHTQFEKVVVDLMHV